VKAGWEVRPLGEVCEFRRGLTYAKGDEVDSGGTAVLRAMNIDLDTGELDLNDIRYIAPSVDVPKSKMVEAGTLLICTASGSKKHLGKAALVDQPMDFAFGGFMGLLVPSAMLLPKYLHWIMRSDAYWEFIDQLSSGTNINNLKFSQLSAFPIPLPPLEEQQRLVAVLDEAFEGLTRARAHAEANLRDARELFASFLHSVGSEKAALGAYVTIRTGKLNANAAVEGGEYPFFTCAREVFQIDKFAFDCEAILLAGNNATGDFNVKHYEGKFNAYQRTYVIEINDARLLDYRYLYFQMIRSLKELKDSSLGTGTKFLKIGMIQNLAISVPPTEVQRVLVDQLDSLNDASADLQSIYREKLQEVERLRQSLLQKAFAGELT
jgi:type I restriction enzyme, S subunit